MRFDMICEANGIEHRLTKPNHPWTNGQVERMNRTIKEATVKRFHYENHNQLRTHLADFLAAYNFARRLKTTTTVRFLSLIQETPQLPAPARVLQLPQRLRLDLTDAFLGSR
jgi:transposase InsO family protein